jgi:hypothetical protein
MPAAAGLAAALRCPLIGRTFVYALKEGHEVWPATIKASPCRGGFDRIAHLNVGGGEGVSCKPTCLRQFGLQIVKMPVELWLDKLAFDAACKDPGHGSDKK